MKNKFDNDLENLIEISKLTIPSLKELRLFGSYNTDKWREKYSDIDVMALLFDENFSERTKIKKGDKNEFRFFST